MKYGYFGKEVKKILIDKDLKNNYLSEYLKVSDNFVSMLFQAKRNISENTVNAIAEILSLNIEDSKKLHIAAIKDNGFVKFHLKEINDEFISDIVDKFVKEWR